MSARITQVPVEVLLTDTSKVKARITQIPVEVLLLDTSKVKARVSQIPVEVLLTDTSRVKARVNQTLLEVAILPSIHPGVDEYTKYLLHGNGADGSTYIYDEVYNPITVYGDAHISTAQSKFSDSSILFDGNGDYLRAPIVDLSSGEMTMESWIYMNSMPTSDIWPSNWSSHMSIIGVGSPGQGNGLNLVLGQTKLILQSNDVQILSGIHNISTGDWHHVATARDENNDVYLWVDGHIVATTNYANAFGTGSYTYIGSETGEGAFFNGHMQEIALLRGKARWKTDFAPPSKPYGTRNNRRRSMNAYGQYFGYWKYN